MTRIAIIEFTPSPVPGWTLVNALHALDSSLELAHYIDVLPKEGAEAGFGFDCVAILASSSTSKSTINSLARHYAFDTEVVLVSNAYLEGVRLPLTTHYVVVDEAKISAQEIRELASYIYMKPAGANKDAQPSYKANIMKAQIADMGLSRRITNNLLAREHMVYVGDLVQRSEAELLRIPAFGRESLCEVKGILGQYGLKLGTDLPDWPPADLGRNRSLHEAARRLAKVRQEPLGATFAPVDDVLAIDADGNDEDSRVAGKPHVGQLHDEIRRKASRFTHVASRLDNQPGWQGIGGFCERLERLLARPTSGVPEVIGSLYSATLELGSFLEMDRKIAAGGTGFAAELDPEVRRPLEDLLSSLAPWMRSFPTVREMDDEAGRFLVRSQLVGPATALVETAGTSRLVAPDDLAVLRGLAEAARRGEFQGIKAGHREVLSVRNMILAASVAVGGLLWTAAESEFAAHSVIGKKAGMFLAAAEGEVLQIVSELPRDLQLAIELIIDEAKRQPLLPARPPSEVPTPPYAPVRRKRR